MKTFLGVFLCLIAVIYASPSLKTAGYCDNYKVVTLVDFPLGESFYVNRFIDSVNVTLEAYVTITDFLVNLTLPYDATTYQFEFASNYTILFNATLPSCGDNFGPIFITGDYCNGFKMLNFTSAEDRSMLLTNETGDYITYLYSNYISVISDGSYMLQIFYDTLEPPVAQLQFTTPTCNTYFGIISTLTNTSNYCSNGRTLTIQAPNLPEIVPGGIAVYIVYDAPLDISAYNITYFYFDYFYLYNESSIEVFNPPYNASTLSLFTIGNSYGYSSYVISSRFDWTLPDCGDNYGGIKLNLSSYCDSLQVQYLIPSTLSYGSYYGYLYVYTTPNAYLYDYVSSIYITEFDEYNYFYLSPPLTYLEVRYFSSYSGTYLQPSGKLVLNSSQIACPVFPYNVTVDGYCNNFKKVVFTMPRYSYAYYHMVGSNYTYYTYNSDNDTSWEVRVTEPGNWIVQFYSQYISLNVTFTVPTCNSNFGPWIVDNSTFCGTGYIVVTNPNYVAPYYYYDDYYLYVTEVNGYGYSYGFANNQTTTVFIQRPGAYILTTMAYGYSTNGSYFYTETSHIEFEITDCGKFYGNLTIDTTGWCQNGRTFDVVLEPFMILRFLLSSNGDYGYYYDPAYEVASYTNFPYNNDTNNSITVQVNLPFAGYYSALLFFLGNSGGYARARYDFVLPQCGPTDNTPISFDSDDYCNNFKQVSITLPPMSVFFVYNGTIASPVANQLITILANDYDSPLTDIETPSPGNYTLFSFVGNMPTTNASGILSRTDASFPDCGSVFGPSVPIVTSNNFCNNFKRVQIEFQGVDGNGNNSYYAIYDANQAFNESTYAIAYIYSNPAIVSLPGAGTYWIISGSVSNPTSSHYFTINDTCPKEFGVFVISNQDFCNNHLQQSILVPPQTTYYFYYDLDINNDTYNPVNVISNYDGVPQYMNFALPFANSSQEFSVVTFNTYYGNQNAFITSRKDFNSSSQICGNLFGPEYIIPSCDFVNSVLLIGGVLPYTTYYLYRVNTVTDALYYQVGYLYVYQETVLKVNLPYGNLFILASIGYNNLPTSKLAIYASALTNSSASFNFPSSVKQGDVAYASVELTDVNNDCFGSATYCRFGSLVIAATTSIDDIVQCQIPSLPVGVYSVSFSIDGGFTFSTSCETLEIVADANLTSFDYVETDSNTNALFLWDSISTASNHYVKIEIFTFNLVTVTGNATILVQQQVGSIYNASANIGQTGWNPRLYDLNFTMIQISFGTSANNFIRRAVVYIHCHWSYCGRQSFCNKYGSVVQPVGTSTQALNPFDQACRSHAFCTNTSLCPSFCDEILISQLSEVLFHHNQPNPFNLNAPISNAVTSSDIAWASIAVIAFSKVVVVSVRVPSVNLPNPCPTIPSGVSISTMACGDPHFTFGSFYFDMQLPGEFVYFRGYLQRSSNAIYVAGNNFTIADAPTTILTQQKPINRSPYISVLTAITILPRQSPHSAIIISTKNGIELYHDGIKINYVSGCPYLFVGGSVVFNNDYDITVSLDDGIQLYLSAGYGSIWCMTMTITGIFVHTQGIYGGLVPSSNPNIPKGLCPNNTLYSLSNYDNNYGDLQNLGYGYCWMLNAFDNLFDYFNITIDSGNFYSRSYGRQESTSAFSERYYECDSLPNQFLRVSCNYDVQYYRLPASTIAAFSAPVGQAFNLATGVNVIPTVGIDVDHIRLQIQVVLQNWNLSQNPLEVAVQKRSAISANLQTISAWVDVVLPNNNYNGNNFDLTLFPSLTNCTTYFARVQVIPYIGKPSPWITASYASLGSCAPSSPNVLPSLTTQPIFTTKPVPTSSSTTASASATTTGSHVGASSIIVPSMMFAMILILSLLL